MLLFIECFFLFHSFNMFDIHYADFFRRIYCTQPIQLKMIPNQLFHRRVSLRRRQPFPLHHYLLIYRKRKRIRSPLALNCPLSSSFHRHRRKTLIRSIHCIDTALIVLLCYPALQPNYLPLLPLRLPLYYFPPRHMQF